MAALAVAPSTRAAQAAAEPAASSPQTIATADLDKQIRDFLSREVTAHVADVKTLDPPPDRVLGALTTGEFSWGSSMRAFSAYADLAHAQTVAGHAIAPMVAKMGLIELAHGGKTWGQLYAALALRYFGADLRTNALWQSLSPADKDAWKSLLDPNRFYDAKTHKVIRLPENYFGVAARIAAIDYQLGLITDRSYVDDLLDRAARQFTEGVLFADDALPTGRYDRYSNEYARAIYDAAATANRKDLMKAIAPSLREQMRLWWDLLAPDGYGYSWGRSLGAISYMDTMEIAAFTAQYPEFRPAPLSELAAAYYAAWCWLRNDFNADTHLLSVFAFGRGEYSYINKEREWQQTTTFFGKIIAAHQLFMPALAKENVQTIAPNPKLDDVARFVSFRDSGRKFGLWVVRQGRLHFALPFVTGPRAATSDYDPAPHGLPGFAAPVEKIYPCLVPFLELQDGRTLAATDGADEIHPSSDARSVTAGWKHWVVVGGQPGETIDPGLQTEVTWSLTGNTLRRSEVTAATKPITVRRLWMAIPTTASHIETSLANGLRTDHLTFTEGALDVRVLHSDLPIHISAFATGDDPLGRGDHAAIPLHLLLQTTQPTLFTPEAPLTWQIELSTNPAPH
jgi:hypothetical protein